MRKKASQSRYVALFRGINVGKAKRIAMADLKAVLRRLGYADVVTLLNSGNAVFIGAVEPEDHHARRIREAVAKKLGVDAHVVVKSSSDIAAIAAGNAVTRLATDPSRLLVALVQEAGSLNDLSNQMDGDWGNERVFVGKQAVYLWCADGILESRVLVKLMGALQGHVTTRNWATLNKIHALMKEDTRMPGGSAVTP